MFNRRIKHFRIPRHVTTLLIFALMFSTAWKAQTNEPNFTFEGDTATHFGVHEISLTGDDSVSNPFDTIATVTFVPPSGADNNKQVYMFYDGDHTWRARVYVTEVGEWTWHSESQDDVGLDGQSGAFTAVESDLRGMLKSAKNNPRQWVTDDGQWFLNLSDTAYRLFNDEETLWQVYIQDDAEMGITSVRAGGLGGYAWGEEVESSNYPWDGEDLTRYSLTKFQLTDTRLQWMLNEYPDIYIQMIIFGQVDWQTDEVGTIWTALPETVRENTMRYMIARWAAYPQIFWLGINDMNCTEESPNNRVFGREVGRYFAANDPWHHLISVSNTHRNVPFCYLGEEDADWVSYIHLQGGHALGAEIVKEYESYPLHVFLGEDYYEQNTDVNHPRNPSYFQRWLFWSWLLSGSSANYGGRYTVIHPYGQSGELAFSLEGQEFSSSLSGLDSVPYIKSYFADRQIDLSLFEPDDRLVSDGNGRNDMRRPELMRREFEEFLIYHPNASEVERFAQVDPNITPGVELDLTMAEGLYSVEWYRPDDGVTMSGEDVAGGGVRDLISPWRGYDFVLRLVRIADVAPSPTPHVDDGRVYDDLLALYTFSENSGSIVHDTSGNERPVHLIIHDPNAVTWAEGGLRVNAPTIVSSERQVRSLAQRVIESNEITLEAWIHPADLTQDGPGRIVTLSSNADSRNVTMGQGEGTDVPAQVYNVRLRTTLTDDNGEPSLSTPPDSTADGLTHVVYTRDAAGVARLYLNGQVVTEGEIGGDLSNWQSHMILALANEITGERPWLGEYRLVALYSRALTSDEVQQNWLIGADPG